MVVVVDDANSDTGGYWLVKLIQFALARQFLLLFDAFITYFYTLSHKTLQKMLFWLAFILVKYSKLNIYMRILPVFLLNASGVSKISKL